MVKPQLRGEQGWIFDNFLMLSDNEDVLHPGIMGTRLDRGFKLEDLNAVYSKVTGRRSFPKSWEKELKLWRDQPINTRIQVEWIQPLGFFTGLPFVMVELNI